MYDLNFFRGNLEELRERLLQRRFELDIDAFRELDRDRRAIVTESETLKAERNEATAAIAKARKAGQDTSAEQSKVRAAGEKITELDHEVTAYEEQLRHFLARVPNVTDTSVPVGVDESANIMQHEWRTPTVFPFVAQAHWDLGARLQLLDLERAAKVAGARFAFYKGQGARLERALAQFMLDLHTGEHGYTEIQPPVMVNSASLFGTGQLPKFAEDLFKCEGIDLWLAPTAEVPVTNYHRDEILDGGALTLSYCAFTSCFRSEAGSYGRDVRGIIRQHQFQKVELVKFTRPENSYDEHEQLTRHAEHTLEKLELPYRRVLLCTGDTGFSAAKTYDLEVWLPGQNAYKEISSCSNFESFQARRAQIRYRPGGKAKPEFVHTLNGSGLAIGRTWVAVVENNQDAEGGIRIPKALQPYMQTERIPPLT